MSTVDLTSLQSVAVAVQCNNLPSAALHHSLAGKLGEDYTVLHVSTSLYITVQYCLNESLFTTLYFTVQFLITY